jgi:hypothetical protein
MLYICKNVVCAIREYCEHAKVHTPCTVLHRLEFTGISGDSPLQGNEERLISYHCVRDGCAMFDTTIHSKTKVHCEPFEEGENYGMERL